MRSVLLEMRQSARRLVASPGFSLGVLITMTLGLALSVGMFTVLNGVLMSSLPYPGGERVVAVVSQNHELNESDGALTGAEAFALEQAGVFEHVGWYVWGGETVLSGDRPREITIHNVSGDYFAALGTQPQLGRWIDERDIGPDRQAVVLSDEEWERLANRDPDIIGKPLRLADETVTVVGVMPPKFGNGAGMWRAADPAWYSSNQPVFINARYVSAFGRLAPDVDAERAAAELDALGARLRETHGQPDAGWRIRTISLLDTIVGDVRAVRAYSWCHWWCS